MSDKRDKGLNGDYCVGYCSPPKSGQFVKGKSGNPRGRPRRPRTAAAGMFTDSEHDRMFLEEMKRQVAVREGEKVERTTIERAALRAIGLKAAKGDPKAFKALTDKQASIDKRRQAEWGMLLEATLEYQKWAASQMKLDTRTGKKGPEMVPHPDDIEIDLNNRTLIFNGPITADQKMAQDFVVSNRSKFFLEFFDQSRLAKLDRRLGRQLRKAGRQMEEVLQLAAKRASKTNSWETATLEERTEFLRREI
jgi:Family of unknown function (DUF5681)